MRSKLVLSKQQGLSLIELMVAIVLGLLLINGALEMLLSSRATFRNTDDVSRIQENGRFATDFLVRNIRMAGYDGGSDTLNGSFFTGTCPVFNGACTSNGDLSSGDLFDQYDRIGIHLDPPPDDGTETDCLGNAVGAGDVIVNVFYVEDLDNDGVNSLYCRSLNTADNTYYSDPQPLVDGVDDLQVLYGITDGDETVEQYMTADNVTDWNFVGAVRLAILVNSGDVEGQDVSQTRRFTLLNGEEQAFTDRHNRRVFSTTVYINNFDSEVL